MANPERKKDSSLPPSLQPHLLRPQGLSPTASTSTQEDTELPLPPFDVPRPRRSASPIRPLAPIPASFSDSRRQFPAYEPGAHEHGSIRPPAGVPSPERLGGPSSIPHGQARRYRSPVASDPTYPIPLRPPGPAYPGSHSLPAPIPRGSQWREGEAGPSSLAHAHPYGGVGRQITPGYPAPQPVHRRATEPGAYSSLVHSQRLHGSYERLRPVDQSGGYPVPGPSSEAPPYSEASQSRVSLPPIYPPFGAQGSAHSGEPLDLPPIYTIRPRSSASSDYTRVDDGDRLSYLHRPDLRRRADDDFEVNPRRTKLQKKILVACDFCRGRKLRCDGVKPTCCNCGPRQIPCKYVDQPKRRGPGKAAKGSKTKKRISKGGREDSDPPPPFPSLDEFKFEMRSLGPELRPWGSLDSGEHSVSSQSTGGRYASQQPSPEGSQGTPRERRTSRSRKRGASSEYSPPPESQ